MDITKVLQDELKNLIDGKTDVKRAKAVSALSAQLIYKERIGIESKINDARIRYWERPKK